MRSALGADRRVMLWSAASEPARLVALGLAAGLVITLAAGRLVASLLYGMRPTDPVTLGTVALVLLLVAVVATWVPARRATKVDPMIALRAE